MPKCTLLDPNSSHSDIAPFVTSGEKGSATATPTPMAAGESEEDQSASKRRRRSPDTAEEEEEEGIAAESKVG